MTFAAASSCKRKSLKLAAVALANKIAMIAWKMMMSGEAYKNTAARPVAACAACRNRSATVNRRETLPCWADT